MTFFSFIQPNDVASPRGIATRLAWVPCVIFAVTAAAACSRNAGLIMSIDSSMATPDVVDEVGITLMNSDGNVFFSNTVALKAGARLPPLDLGVAPSDGPIRGVVVGFRRGAPQVFREAVATSPEAALQLLQVGLDWENWGSATLEALPGASVTARDAPKLLADSNQGRTRVYHSGRWVRNSCLAGETPLGGICASALETGLPDYNADLELGGPERRCFDTDACMSGGYEVLPPQAIGKTCTTQLSSAVQTWIGNGDRLNVSVEAELDPGTTRLMASSKSREGSRLDGWRLEANGKLVLPLTFCMPDPAWVMPVLGKAPTATTYDWVWSGPKKVLLSTRCASKKRDRPVCQKGGALKSVDVAATQGNIPQQPILPRGVSQEFFVNLRHVVEPS